MFFDSVKITRGFPRGKYVSGNVIHEAGQANPEKVSAGKQCCVNVRNAEKRGNVVVVASFYGAPWNEHSMTGDPDKK